MQHTCVKFALIRWAQMIAAICRSALKETKEEHMRFEFAVDLKDTPENIWKSIRTFRAINEELFPVMQMTSPRNFTDKPFEEFPIGKHAFNSVVLFLGLIPIEVSQACLANVDKNVGFTENSKMILAKNWIHKRTLVAVDHSCRVIDELEVIPRSFVFYPLFYGFVNLVFWNRHRQLKRRFNKIIDQSELA